MAKITPVGRNKRKIEDTVRRPAKKIRKFKKQKEYHSESEDEVEDANEQDAFTPVKIDASEEEEVEEERETAPKAKAPLKSALKPSKASQPEVDADTEEESDEDLAEDDEPTLDDDGSDDTDASSVSGSEASEATGANRTKKKRSDPTAFATSMSKILSSKLTSSKRADPVLSRSATAAQASKELNDARLETKAKRQLHAEKRQALEKGRVKDVLGLNSTDVSTAEIQDQERRLKKTAQRGVIKLFNAVRAAQVQGEKAMAEARKEGL
ncbi:pre-60S ribosomal particles component [Taxawa tesnikishii (nom. ined.)]|nr:pre-60S ribosomal particles component [Dothideales sp. JES 119]